MSQHVVWVQHFGYEEEQESITFNAAEYTREEVEAFFVPYSFISQKGFQQIGYEYAGEKFYRFSYLGLFPDDKIPASDEELWEYREFRIDE